MRSWKRVGTTLLMRIFRPIIDLSVLRMFPMFRPASIGPFRARATLTVGCINECLPRLGALAHLVSNDLAILPAPMFSQAEGPRAMAIKAKQVFDEYGSDKGSMHGYHHIYGRIFRDPLAVRGVLEIGIGTNHTDVVSNMGRAGSPGASLRALRDLLPSAHIYGADIDTRILFTEDRIDTYQVDQMDTESILRLERAVPDGLDVVIDDGLHSPAANLGVIMLSVRKVKVGGWVVIEDIVESAVPVWQVVAALLRTSWSCYLLKAEHRLAFVAERGAV